MQGIIVPLCGRNGPNMTVGQSALNSALSKQRMKVEQSYGCLKKGWKRIHHNTGLDGPNLLGQIVRVCIGLSNLLNRKG